MTADKIRQWAAESLDSDKAWGVGGCGRPYYIIGGKEVGVTREFRRAMQEAYMGFDLLEDGRVIGWFDREHYELWREAGKMAMAVEQWRRLCA